MKKFIFLILSVILAAGVVDAKTTKKSSTSAKKKTTAVIPITKGEVKNYGDYLTTQVFTAQKGKDSKLYVEYPIGGNPELVSAVRNYIKEMLDSKFKGSLATPEALMRAVMKDLRDVRFGEPGTSRTEEIKVIHSTPNIITFSDKGSEYAGGAHGMGWNMGSTFLVSTGEQLGINDFPPIPTMRPYILQGLAKNFDTTVSQLGDIVFSPDEIEMPGTVFLTGDGIVFAYQPYEIGPYAIGAPEAIVPATTELVKKISPKGQRFFK